VTDEGDGTAETDGAQPEEIPRQGGAGRIRRIRRHSDSFPA
jgi:hypothetical protein